MFSESTIVYEVYIMFGTDIMFSSTRKTDEYTVTNQQFMLICHQV